MATEPIKISGMTQSQRNAIIAALGCKTIHRMNNGDSLPVGFEPDELIITHTFETEKPGTEHKITNPAGYYFVDIEAHNLNVENADLSIGLTINDTNVINNLPDGGKEYWRLTPLSSIYGFAFLSSLTMILINNYGTNFQAKIRYIKY